MGLYESAKDALKEIPMADVIRERLSLALDRLAEAERQISVLQTEKGGLQAQFERERLDHEKTKQELKALQDSHHEEIRFVLGVEFRKGTRTSGKWEPFCPKCHLPLVYSPDSNDPIYCDDITSCKWRSGARSGQVRHTAAELS